MAGPINFINPNTTTEIWLGFTGMRSQYLEKLSDRQKKIHCGSHMMMNLLHAQLLNRSLDHFEWHVNGQLMRYLKCELYYRVPRATGIVQNMIIWIYCWKLNIFLSNQFVVMWLAGVSCDDEPSSCTYLIRSWIDSELTKERPTDDRLCTSNPADDFSLWLL